MIQVDYTALIAAAAALLGAAAGFMAKTRLADVIASPSSREETAVNKMAGLLERSSARDEKTIDQVFAMLDKAVDTVAKQTGALQQIALGIQGHERDSGLRWQHERDSSTAILKSLDDVKLSVDGLEQLVTDVTVEMLKSRRADQELKKQEGHGEPS